MRSGGGVREKNACKRRRQATVVAGRRDVQLGLSRRRSRVRVPSLPFYLQGFCAGCCADPFPSRAYPALLACACSEMAVKRSDRLGPGARIEVPVALPDEHWFWPSYPVRVTSASAIWRIGARCDHERGEVVAKVVESEPSELVAPARFSLLSRPPAGLGEDVAGKLSEFQTRSERGEGKTRPCRCRERASSCSRTACMAGAQRYTRLFFRVFVRPTRPSRRRGRGSAPTWTRFTSRPREIHSLKAKARRRYLEEECQC